MSGASQWTRTFSSSSSPLPASCSPPSPLARPLLLPSRTCGSAWNGASLTLSLWTTNKLVPSLVCSLSKCMKSNVLLPKLLPNLLLPKLLPKLLQFPDQPNLHLHQNPLQNLLLLQNQRIQNLLHLHTRAHLDTNDLTPLLLHHQKTPPLLQNPSTLTISITAPPKRSKRSWQPTTRCSPSTPTRKRSTATALLRIDRTAQASCWPRCICATSIPRRPPASAVRGPSWGLLALLLLLLQTSCRFPCPLPARPPCWRTRARSSRSGRRSTCSPGRRLRSWSPRRRCPSR